MRESTGAEMPARARHAADLAFDPPTARRTAPPCVPAGVPAGVASQPVLGPAIPDVVTHALGHARAAYAELVAQDEPRFKLKLSQLLPFKLAGVTSWGADAAQQQSRLATDAATVMRTYSDLNGSEVLETTLDAARANPSRLQRLITRHRSLDDCRLSIIALRERLQQLIPECEEFINEQDHLARELALYLAVLSVSADVTGAIADAVLAGAVDQRRRALQSSNQQAQVLKQTLQELRGLIVALLGNIDHGLNVTLPAIELAKVGAAGR
ncbi:hypothetical protein F6X40_35335 [Paraburkholderia sp. UCT31]|uniref:hypothetical protein n=1 Tax=Paraburkholderia sp. UCT31 TaxID=2615209 RepID=UPI001654DF1B|nr:hypothetical protein [Paraburkholderia sp. UCT31]MBC8741824.1 hypothetical protein [Paraburkholderia sp. UCT31]